LYYLHIVLLNYQKILKIKKKIKNYYILALHDVTHDNKSGDKYFSELDELHYKQREIVEHYFKSNKLFY